MNSNRNKKALIGIAVALVLPLSFYIIAKGLGKDKLAMPVYYHGDKKMEAHEGSKLVKEGVIKSVADLQAVNQFSENVSLNRDLPGKMLAIDFIFTNCTDFCPKLTGQMKRLEYAFRQTPMKRNDTMVQFISISVDPARDSAMALLSYAKAAGVDQNHWWFLTADKKTVYDWMRHELHLAVPSGDGGADDFIHTQQIVVLDKDRFIRGYYDGLDTAAVIRCANDLGLLAMEKKR
jgi:protein SCO1/2